MRFRNGIRWNSRIQKRSTSIALYSPYLIRYYITDRRAAGGFRQLLEIIEDQIELGVEYIQIREKDLTARQLFEFTLAVLERRARRNTKILVNSRADVARAAGADGVHLPAASPSAVLPGLLIGRSCHTLEEIRQSNADLVTFGPIFPSPGKALALGLETLRQAAATGKKVFALGGIDWDNAEACLKAGACGIAGIRLFQNPEL